MAVAYAGFVGISIMLLKEFNSVVPEPYMDEPFHIPQAQAYCRGEFDSWDPKITTPPGLYILSLLLKKVFMLKCNVPMLRLTTLLPLLALPIVLARLMCFHQGQRLPSQIMAPTVDAIVLSTFPIAYFFGFMYYTETPSVLFVVGTVVAAMQNRHWLAALLGSISCTFRQTNVIWVLYAYASSQLMYLRFRRAPPGAKPFSQLHDPPALAASLGDFIGAVSSAPKVFLDILPAFVPYALVLGLFAAFVVWNGGIVLGDKSNHIPSLHIPQLYYFIAFSAAFGWPVLISGEGGIFGLVREVGQRMFGSKLRILATALTSSIMAVTVNLYTIHHPFLLSDNRHYTFYIWHRIYMRYPAPYLLVPIYIACAWAWFLRVGVKQTMLQTILLPVFVLPTLLPTPLLEPRYFLIPYILLRSQVSDVPTWALALEGLWYAAINAATMWVFLYMPRENVGRFMW
ncbi:glucosyltransferase [Mycena maculata]|uniref:Dol-P-Glc:Glc(2)Man(9)GlcNAc(2)-PP-Dol alpha-1,2-glucosyltransferase n=1 Tax=Mycena maculata TaxID=230809 RepID=A0AAD7JSI2_9AGAR|nr:glucosyltransferase [Mycena maculata]